MNPLRRPTLLNDMSLTNQNDGLGNSSNLTNQDFYVRLVDVKNEENNSVLAGRSLLLSSQYFRVRFDPFPSFLRRLHQQLQTYCHVRCCV